MDSRVAERCERTPMRGLKHPRGQRGAERAPTLRERLGARIEAREVEAARALVREARGHVKGFDPVRAVSANTVDRYAATVVHMRANGEGPEAAACRASFEFRRAALVHTTRASIKASLRDWDRANRQGYARAANDALGQVRADLETLRRYPPSSGDREQDMRRRSAYCGPQMPVRSNSKRASAVASDLPADWRDRIQAAVVPADRPALAAMALTGCRPAEVRGVKVQQDDRAVTLVIRGAKVDEARGVKVRAITIDKTELALTQAGRDLKAWLGERPVRTVAYAGSCEALRDRAARAAARAGLSNVTSYTYRHAEARDLRAGGASRAEVTARLGHRSERSQRQYG